jgi:hypothetical protein
MSTASLTGYDNRDALSGQPDAEVYLYDAVSRGLVCASCNPTGARPTGEYDTRELEMDRTQAWVGEWLSAMIPTWTPINISTALYQPRYLSDEGRLFFDSAEALVPQDTNGREDVYEYEPVGVGGCRQVGGCVYLISGGAGKADSTFLDASASGNDVFFHTNDQLVSQDYDHVFDVYDAHACTSSDACKPSPTPQPTLFGAPASATFAGNGNVSQSVAPVKAKPKRKPSKHKHRHRHRARKSGADKTSSRGARR